MIEAHGMERLGQADKVDSSYVADQVHSSSGASQKLSSRDRDRKDLAVVGKTGQLPVSRKFVS